MNNAYLSQISRIANKPVLSIIIPVYNEEERLPDCIQTLTLSLAHFDFSYEIIIVDNGSTDATLRICSELARLDSHVNFEAIGVKGKGFAVRHGMLVARGQYRYMCDVDLSCPFGEMIAMLDKIKTFSFDMVIGSRALPGSDVRTSNLRQFSGRVFHHLIGWLTPGIQDTQCGFKMFTAQAARDIFERVQTRGLAFDVEVLWLAQRLGYKVMELPVLWMQGGESRVHVIRDGLRMLAEAFRIPFLHSEFRRVIA